MDTKEMVTRKRGDVEPSKRVQSITPLVDIYENDEEILLHAEMPGVEKKEIKINIDNGSLTLAGTRHIGKSGAAGWQEFGDVEFYRAFSVPQTIDVEKVTAEHKDGVLHLHLPKSEASKPKMIEIKAG